jgi:hypothetical protein
MAGETVMISISYERWNKIKKILDWIDSEMKRGEPMGKKKH